MPFYASDSGNDGGASLVALGGRRQQVSIPAQGAPGWVLEVDADAQTGTLTQVVRFAAPLDGDATDKEIALYDWTDQQLQVLSKKLMPSEYKRSCAFCGRSGEEVSKLIAGPSAYICSDCVVLCNEIMNTEQEEPG
jgi:hypothetical protein